MAIEDILTHLDDEDRERFTQAVSAIGKAFEAQTSVAVQPESIVGLNAVRDYVLTGGEIELDLSAAITELQEDPKVSNALIAAQAKVAEANKIASDTANMSRTERMNYARANGLDKPRPDTTSSMTRNEHDAVLAGLSPIQRMNYARRHGLT
ncbi:hypothetical protein Ga0609869_000027 [Rhodovulum iodosum]|uniref:Uncharacterized protein n=1 Tax=Rhodovulum iodosum TaxID=68291 RepID=A0ABV3XMY2_9RHOB|nr:hypothetical protein [Rhodovulum robiginosum]RSK35817.1 hypothetical protein EJA01_05565 [Rhodovulum robiginosum]